MCAPLTVTVPCHVIDYLRLGVSRHDSGTKQEINCIEHIGPIAGDGVLWWWFDYKALI